MMTQYSRTQRLVWALALGVVLIGATLWGLNASVAADSPSLSRAWLAKGTSLRPQSSHELMLNVNYAHDWIEGHYEPDHTVWLTVTDSAGVVKARAELTTGEVPGWDGDSGFSTSWGEPWQPRPPDIEPYDWVYGLVGNGYTATVRVGQISADLDVDQDLVSGTIQGPWLNLPVNGSCSVWDDNGVDVPFTTTVDGSFVCDLGEMGWDLLPGQQVWVEYQDPGGGVVINVFEEPAPKLHIEKSTQGEPGEGGNFVFEIRFRNEGSAPAEDVVITDTMEGFAYLDDTSGFPVVTDVMPDGTTFAVWELGTVAPGDWVRFFVFTSVVGEPGDPVRNLAEIATSDPYNQSEPWQLEAEWEGIVGENDTRLEVHKFAWTHAPAPGQEFVYQVGVCNVGSTGSSMVTLTDTLPLSTTLISWWAQEPGWQEVESGDHHLVVEHPSIAGSGECKDVRIRVYLDEAAWPLMELVNQAEISADNDLEPERNQIVLSHQTRLPFTHLTLEKDWSGGMLVPGGELRYGIRFANEGNVPVHAPIRITDTLPVSTTLREWRLWGDADISLVEFTETHVIWELDGLDNGFGGDLELVLDVDEDALPGTVLLNHAEITRLPGEVDVHNNRSTWEETLYPHGPNVRVRKEAAWDRDADPRRAEYWLLVENVGDQPADSVTVTDHYPVGMVLDGEPHFWWRDWDWADHPDEGFLTITLGTLEPGQLERIHYNLRFPGQDPVPLGEVFTNTAEVTLVPGDTNPDDNSAGAVLGSGPDLYVRKRLLDSEAEIEPGDLITFSLVFGNSHPWNTQGNVRLTDTLPEGLHYVSAQQRWCGPYEPWCPNEPEVDGQNLVWAWGPLHGVEEHEIYLTVQVSDTVRGPATLVNYVEIASDQPDADVEAFYDNNVDSLSLYLLPPDTYTIYLPLVVRSSP